MNVTVTYYDAITGRISKCISLPDALVSSQLKNGEAILYAKTNPSTHRIDQGEVVDIPPKPGEYFEFDWVSKVWIEPQDVINRIRSDAATRVDKLAGEKRAQYITITPGQDATYTAKLEDAKAYIAAGYPSDASPYIWVNAEANATQSNPAIVADLIVSTARFWAQKGAQIEANRQVAKRAISLATGALEVYDAEMAFKLSIASI